MDTLATNRIYSDFAKTNEKTLTPRGFPDRNIICEILKY